MQFTYRAVRERDDRFAADDLTSALGKEFTVLQPLTKHRTIVQFRTEDLSAQVLHRTVD